jgi:hypothetical protein
VRRFINHFDIFVGANATAAALGKLFWMSNTFTTDFDERGGVRL